MRPRTEDVLRTLLESMSYEVEAPARVVGRSGIFHDFTVCARRGEEKKVAIEVQISGRSAEISILAFYTKALDTGFDRLLLVTDAPVTDEAVRLAELYNIRIISSGKSAEDFELQPSDFLNSNRAGLSLDASSSLV